MFLVFYGVFLATSLLSLGRYRLFDTNVLWARGEDRQRAVARLGLGIGVMTAFPLVWFGLLGQIIPERHDPWALAWAAAAGLSAFGFHRLLHGLIAADTTAGRFYSEDQWARVLCQWQDDWPGQWPNQVAAHMAPGLGYLLFGAAAALLPRLIG